MAAEGFPVARIDEHAKPCEPAIHVLRSVVSYCTARLILVTWSRPNLRIGLICPVGKRAN